MKGCAEGMEERNGERKGRREGGEKEGEEKGRGAEHRFDKMKEERLNERVTWDGREGRSERRCTTLARGLGPHHNESASAGSDLRLANLSRRRCLTDAAQALAVTGSGCPLVAICGTAEAVWRDLALFPRDTLYT